MAATRTNPFMDLPLANAPANTPANMASSNPFLSLPVSDSEEKKAILKKIALGDMVTPAVLGLAKPIISGLEKGGENIAKTFTGGYAPSGNIDEMMNYKDPNILQRFVEGGAQFAPAIATGGLGLLPDLAMSAGFGATQAPTDQGFKQQLINSTVGAGIGAGGNLAARGLGLLAGSTNPIVSLLGRSGAGALAGYGIGGTPESAEIGAGIGAFGKNLLGEAGLRSVGKDIVSMTTPQETQARRIAGEALGTPLSPGEAAGRGDVMGEQELLGRVGEGAKRKAQLREERIAQQQQAISGFKNQIAPGGGDPARAVRDVAKGYIDELEQTREKAAEPHYKAAENEQIPQDQLDNLLEVPRIKQTFNDVLDDPELVYELGGQQPTGKKMIAMVENRIDNLLSKARSKPYNKDRIDSLQYAKDNLTSDYGDPRVQDVLKEIYKDDPVFHATALGIDTRSIKFLDTVKKRIDTLAENQASALNPSGKDKYKAGLIKSSADLITNIADQYSPSYALAREAHAQHSPLIDEAKGGVIGRLANLDDKQLKNASKIIFDPSQTNPYELQKLKLQIMRRSPNAWNGIVRNELDRLMKAGNLSGPNFYNKVLKNENQYNQFRLALDHNPVAVDTLENMKTAWEHLKNPDLPKTTAGAASRGMNTLRESFSKIIDKVNKITGTKKQAADLEYLYSNRWAADYQNIAKIKNAKSRDAKIAEMMGRLLPPQIINNLLATDNQEQ